MAGDLVEGYNTSLAGVKDITKLTTVEGDKDKRAKDISTIILMVFSALIFLTIVTIYAVIEAAMRVYFSNGAIRNGDSKYTEKELAHKKRKNYNRLLKSMVYCAVCVVGTIIIIVLLAKYM